MRRFNDPNRGILSLRRLTLLGSAAVVGAALVLGGPLEYGHFTSQAQAATTQAQQGPAGFADLIAKVKPAVISVRVKVDESADENSPNTSGQELQPFMQGSPFEKFFRQFGENGPRGFERHGMQRHQTITGVGSGFFISADGYAVTNNHVVDHAS
jgi:serine protease Do